ncbi:MAG: hypothetical protein AB7H90_12330 [Alphaproteobacteria bacterium]
MKHFLNGVAIAAALAIAAPAVAQAQSFRASPSDNVANQLNQQELQRLQAGPAAGAMTAPAPMTSPGARVSGGGNIPAPTGPRPMPPPPPIAAPVR